MSAPKVSLPTLDTRELVEVCSLLDVRLSDPDLQAMVDAAKAALAAAQARPLPVWGLDGLIDAFEPAPVCENPF